MVFIAGISAAGALGGAFLQSNAAQTAAGEQAQASSNALALQKQMFGTAQSALSPYYTAGQSALPTLQKLLTPGAGQTSTLEQLPGFQFQSQWGTLSAQNALAAQGLGGSTGPLATAISNYNNGLAQTSYGNYLNQLQNFAGMGTSAAGALAGDAISAGNSMGQTTQNIGTALASGTLGSANALSSGLTGAAGGAGNALLLSSLMGGGSGGIYGTLTSGGGLASPASSAFNPYSVDI